MLAGSSIFSFQPFVEEADARFHNGFVTALMQRQFHTPGHLQALVMLAAFFELLLHLRPVRDVCLFYRAVSSSYAGAMSDTTSMIRDNR